MKEFMKGLKIGIGIVLPILLLVTLAVTVFAIPIQEYFVTKSYDIPYLSIGSCYEVVLEDSPNMTCVDIEKELGLKRGDVAQISSDPNGMVVITFTKDLKLKDSDISALSYALDKKVKEVSVK